MLFRPISASDPKHRRKKKETNLYKCLRNKATAKIGTIVWARVFKCRTAGSKSIRIRKVLRPANSTKISRGFPRSLQ
jgi:hypothetical protein